MKLDILLGLQWGDEGKGKIVDLMSDEYDVVARFQGGPNAGHSLEFDDKKYVLHIIPSGVFRGNTLNVIGNGTVIDPVVFKQEIEKIEQAGYSVKNKIVISRKAHLILPTHRILDAASEASKGKEKIGSTLKGIGPTYMDKTGRNGLRVGDSEMPDFKEKYQHLVSKHKHLLQLYDYSYDLSQYEKDWFDGIDVMKQFPMVDGEYLLNKALSDGKRILAEGAQGTLLDIDYGSYPFVTSSNTISSGASIGLGIAPGHTGEVYGIFKAYCTRVGGGPFPTELVDETGRLLQEAGNEYGATTGRPRRCGWLDLVALKYAVMINGVTKLIMTKADVLDEMDPIKVATHYQTPAGKQEHFPFSIEENSTPVYKEFKGWEQPVKEARSFQELPQSFRSYLDFLEQELEVPISIVSVGPDRSQTIFR